MEYNESTEKDKIGLGPRLKHERTIRKVSKAEVAKATGINVTTIARIELGYACHYSTALLLIKWIEYL